MIKVNKLLKSGGEIGNANTVTKILKAYAVYQSQPHDAANLKKLDCCRTVADLLKTIVAMTNPEDIEIT